MKSIAVALIVPSWLILSGVCGALARHWAEAHGYAEHQAQAIGDIAFATVSVPTIIVLLVLYRRMS